MSWKTIKAAALEIGVHYEWLDKTIKDHNDKMQELRKMKQRVRISQKSPKSTRFVNVSDLDLMFSSYTVD